MPNAPVQEIACQQVLVEDSSVFSIQWSLFPESVAAGLTAEDLVARYLEYVRQFTATFIRPEILPEGIRFRLLSSRLSVITFNPLVLHSDNSSSSAVLHVNGGILVQPRECIVVNCFSKLKNSWSGSRFHCSCQISAP